MTSYFSNFCLGGRGNGDPSVPPPNTHYVWNPGLCLLVPVLFQVVRFHTVLICVPLCAHVSTFTAQEWLINWQWISCLMTSQIPQVLHTHAHTNTHTCYMRTWTCTHKGLIMLANSIHSSMNSLEDLNEYFTKPTTVRNRSWYIRSDGLPRKSWKVMWQSEHSNKIFVRPGYILGLLVQSAVTL